jgi:hypothetical protein
MTAGSLLTISSEPGAKRNGVGGREGTGGVKRMNCASPLGKRQRLWASGDDGGPWDKGIGFGVLGEVKFMARMVGAQANAKQRAFIGTSYSLGTKVLSSNNGPASQSLYLPSKGGILTNEGKKHLILIAVEQKKTSRSSLIA